jgi:hypothetical protein
VAQGPTWGADRGNPSVRDIIPDPRGVEAYSERYTFFAKLDGGGEAYVDVTISNLGWGDKHGVTTGRIRIPGDKTYKFKKKLDEDDWSYSRDQFEIAVGPTKISGTPEEGFKVAHTGKRPFELVFKSKTSMWRPGNGRFMHDGKIYGTILAVPWGDVTGWVSGADGRSEISGVGMFDHGISTVAPFNLADKFSRMRHFENGLFIAWREIDLTDDAGGDSITWVVVGLNDRIIFSDSAAKIEWSGHETHSDSEHSVPTAVRITGTEGGKKLTLEVSGRRVRADDLLAQYGSAARMVAGTVSNPWQFEIRGRYNLSITGSRSVKKSGRTSMEFDILTDN